MSMISRCMLVSIITLFLIAPAFGQAPIQLDKSCIVTVGNQTVFVRPDGSFLIQNISVFQSRTTGIAPQLYRVRATCVRNGETITGQSEFFELTPGRTAFIADVFPSALDPIPVSVNVSAPGGSLGPGASLQLTTVATLPDGSTEDVTPRSAGTTYLSTNPAVLSVTEDGFVTSVYAGTFQATGTIAALNEGNITTVNITAVPPSNDLDGDGMPNDYEDLFGLNKFVNDANLDLDNDGLTNITEFNLGTIPNNPDTDVDGVIDGVDCDPLVPENAAPTVQILSPADGATLIEGETIQFSVNANDDSVLVSVELSTDTGFSQLFPNPGCNASIQVSFTVPTGPSQIVFTATATDSLTNVTAPSVIVNVIPDPLTTVIGVVLDPDDNPVDGAALSTNGGVTGFSLADGSFFLPNVPTILGDIVVSASADLAGQILTGNSAATPAEVGGVTDVGAIVVAPIRFDLRFVAGLSTTDLADVFDAAIPPAIPPDAMFASSGNGVIFTGDFLRIGVNSQGSLIFARTGLRFAPSGDGSSFGSDVLFRGTDRDVWGVRFDSSGSAFFGFGGSNLFPNDGNVMLVSFGVFEEGTLHAARSVTEFGPLQITTTTALRDEDQVVFMDVSFKNIGSDPIENLRYSRSADFDINARFPNSFDVFETPARATIISAGNNGLQFFGLGMDGKFTVADGITFANRDPNRFSNRDPNGIVGDFSASFVFFFDPLGPGESITLMDDPPPLGGLGTVSGLVENEQGPVQDAVVHLTSLSTSVLVTTGEDGWFVATEMPTGERITVTCAEDPLDPLLGSCLLLENGQSVVVTLESTSSIAAQQSPQSP